MSWMIKQKIENHPLVAIKSIRDELLEFNPDYIASMDEKGVIVHDFIHNLNEKFKEIALIKRSVVAICDILITGGK